jgi:hypothetical protein
MWTHADPQSDKGYTYAIVSEAKILQNLSEKCSS